MLKTESLSNFYTEIIKIGTLIILFLPLFAFDKAVFPFIFPKTIAFRIIIEILLVAYIALAVIRPKFRPRFNLLLGSLTAFLGIVIATSLFGADVYHSFWSSIERSEGIITWLHLLAFFIVISNTFREKEMWQGLLHGVIIAGWLQALYALGQFFGLSFALQYGGERIGGAVGNASFLATYLIFTIYLAAYHFFSSPKRLPRTLAAGLIIVDLFLLWQTQTRGAILALVVSLLFIISWWLWQLKTKRSRATLAAVWIISISAIAGLFTFKDLPVVRSSMTLARLTNISVADITAQNRLIVWNVGLQGFAERPLQGWGWENFNVAFNRYFDPAITRDIGSAPWYDRAHNIVVEVGVTAGIFGLLAYLFIFSYCLFLLTKNSSKKPLSMQRLLLVGLLTAYFLQNLFVFDTVVSLIMFFFTLGLIHVHYTPRPKKNKTRITKATVKPLVGFGVPIGLFLICCTVIYGVNVRPVLANYYVFEAVTKDKNNVFKTGQNFTKAFNYSPPNDQELRFILVQHTRDLLGRYGITEGTLPLLRLSLQEMEKTIVASPEAVQNYLILAELYMAAAPIDTSYLSRAQSLMEEALTRAPSRYQIYTSLGRLSMERGEFDEGINYFEKAIRLNDQFAEAHWNLAIAYILSGQFESGYDALAQAQALGLPIHDPRYADKLISAFRDSKDLIATVNYLETIVKNNPDNASYKETYDSLRDLLDKVLQQSGKTQ